jgi:uncharacterized protein YidB (DUF937 family)
MAGFDDMVRSAVPGGNIGKPLLLALGALLASGALFRNRAQQSQIPQQSPSPGSEAQSTGSAGGLLSGLGGLLDTLRQGGLSHAADSWVGGSQNHPVSSNELSSALGPDLIRALAQRSGLSEEEVGNQLSKVLPGLVDKLTPNGRLPTEAEVSRIL